MTGRGQRTGLSAPSPGRRSRTKGAAGEREVAAIFREHGFDCDRVPNSGGLRLRGDLYGTLPAHVEVKRQERLQLWEWVAQAEEECGDATPIVAFRRSRTIWRACLPLDALVKLYAEARP